MQRARLQTPLKLALEEDGRRQTWLADRLGVDPRQVWGWVHGIHIPSVATQEAIAELLSRDAEALWPETSDEAAA